MLRMAPFTYEPARTYAEALDLWLGAEAPMYVAGGTDLLPNLKHGIVSPRTLVSLGEIAGGIAEEAGAVVIGAATKLNALATNDVVRALLPPLARAASLIAGPQIRAMGTLGGNVLLDTRCLYYNQTAFWRGALGHCLKAEGTWCHVINGPKTCVAAQSSDTVPVLLALDASLRFLGPAGPRTVAIRDLYRFNGMDHLAIEKGELLTDIVVPKPGAGFRGSYQKLRTRDSIDFPQLGVAITGTFDGPVPTTLDIVIGAANPQPKPVRGLEPFLGRPLDDTAAAAIADLVHKQTRPQAAVHGDPAWRRQMASVFTRRGLLALASGA
ncbi:MAG: FAD binding domain-containing protein [Pseudomonadota bacterium]|nr:FAD binding domain-containing protein [Pseudomonadota bacterium]